MLVVVRGLDDAYYKSPNANRVRVITVSSEYENDRMYLQGYNLRDGIVFRRAYCTGGRKVCTQDVASLDGLLFYSIAVYRLKLID